MDIQELQQQINELQQRHDDLRNGKVLPRDSSRPAEHEALDLYYQIQDLYIALEEAV